MSALSDTQPTNEVGLQNSLQAHIEYNSVMKINNYDNNDNNNDNNNNTFSPRDLYYQND